MRLRSSLLGCNIATLHSFPSGTDGSSSLVKFSFTKDKKELLYELAANSWTKVILVNLSYSQTETLAILRESGSILWEQSIPAGHPIKEEGEKGKTTLLLCLCAEKFRSFLKNLA